MNKLSEERLAVLRVIREVEGLGSIIPLIEGEELALYLNNVLEMKAEKEAEMEANEITSPKDYRIAKAYHKIICKMEREILTKLGA